MQLVTQGAYFARYSFFKVPFSSSVSTYRQVGGDAAGTG